jgi:hypothetical protein
VSKLFPYENNPGITQGKYSAHPATITTFAMIIARTAAPIGSK